MTTLTQPVSPVGNTVHGDVFHRIVGSISKLIAGLRDGLAAKRAYDDYRAHGASHADAVTRAFDAGYNG